MTQNRLHLLYQRGCSVVFNHALCFALTVAMALAILTQFAKINFFMERADMGVLGAMLGFPCAVALGFYLLTRPWFARLSEGRFLALTLGGSGLLHVLVLVVRPFYITKGDDFLKMHELAIRMIQAPIRDVLSLVTDLYGERVLVYHYPWYLLFGPSLPLVRLYNVLLLLVAGACLYAVSRAALSDRRMARAALVSFFLIPARYLYVNVPSHDISGIFYLGLFSLVFLKAYNAWEAGRVARLAAWSAVLGIVMLLASLARTIYIPLLLTLLAIVGWHGLAALPRIGSPSAWRRGALLALFLLLLPMAICKSGLTRIAKTQTAVSNAGLLFIANSTTGSGLVEELRYFRNYILQLPDARDLNRFGYGRLASEITYNPMPFVRMMLRKSTTLNDTGQELRYNLAPEKEGTCWSWGIPTWLHVSIILSHLLQFGLGLIGLIWLVKRRFHPRLHLMAVFALVFSGIVMLSEVQYRYTYMLHLYYAMMAGIGMIGVCDVLQGRRTPVFLYRRRAAATLAATIVAALVALLAVRWGIGVAARAGDCLFVDLSKPVELTVDKGDEAAVRKAFFELEPVPARPFLALLQLPGTPGASVGAAWDWDVKAGGKYRLKCFLRSYSKVRGPVDLKLTVNGRRAAELRGVMLDGLRFIEGEAGVMDRDKARIQLTATQPAGGTKAEPVDVSLEYLMLARTER